MNHADCGGPDLVFRLPKNVVPIHYRITLEPDLINHTFNGEEIVEIVLKEETNKIVLHSFNLVIKEVSFKYNDSVEFFKSKNIELNTENEQLIITFGSNLKAGTSGELKIAFSGVLNDNLEGFYRARYPQGEGQPDKWAATTQFETTYARRAFPCWDEPAIKATFQVKIIAPSDKICLSNMPVISEDVRPDGKKEVLFDVSPIMSTYLVAIVVGEFEYLESTVGNVKIGVYIPPGKKEQGHFALEVAKNSLSFFTRYFNVEYPLPKLDMIAISDFGAGAMENWGLITYRETALLLDPVNSSPDIKIPIALVVAHEIAHQWFGNLVTMEWWNDIWLNEGFATFMASLCIDSLFPEFNIWPEFVRQKVSGGLRLDVLQHSHPIDVPVNNPSEINEVFDSISYSKGASIIRMLHSYLGDEDFRKGMSLYLNRHKYKNTRTVDLWAALEEASSKPVREMMTTWTTQVGFPVISASRTFDEGKQILKLRQEKFCANGKLPDFQENQQWNIPITWTSASLIVDNASHSWRQKLLTTKENEFVISDIHPSDWIIVNHNSYGFYRVEYSTDMLEQLLKGIESKTVQPIDRLSLLDDMLALVMAGKKSTVELLKFLEKYKYEDNYNVWSLISRILSRLNLLISHTDFQPSFHAWSRKFLQPIYQKVGWELKVGEQYNDTLLRSLILERLASFEDPEVVHKSKRLFEAFVTGTMVIRPNIRSVVYCAVGRHADDQTFDTFFKLYRATDQQEEKNRLVEGMAAVRDVRKLEKVLNFSISDDVRIQDSDSIIALVAWNEVGRELAWKFVKDNHDLFKKRFSGGLYGLVSITANFASEEKAQEVESFFIKNPFPGTERTLHQSLEYILINAGWLARDAADVQKFLGMDMNSMK